MFVATMNSTISSPCFAAAPSLVGSFPHAEGERLVERIVTGFRELPAWPQLPARDWLESMYVQYSEGLPGAVVDRETQRIYFRTGDAFYAGLEEFYTAVVGQDVERFAIGEEYALGLHLFLDRIGRLGTARPQWVKGQITGPFSFGMTVTDENKRALAYNPELYEVAVQGLALKARWLARRLKQVAGGVLVTLDEPYLCSFGSAFVNVPRESVITAIDAAVEAVHREGALAGLHCCGNTDWSLVLATAVDVINFDAWEFAQGLSLYPDELRDFLQRGGTLAWGIVPASRSCEEIRPDALADALAERVALFEAKGLDRATLYRQALLTPTCGLGTETEARAEQTMDVLVELTSLVRHREGLG
jgi:methionine synthase II (cobalamin-independent)